MKESSADQYRKARHALMLVVNAILETVRECGEQGAPLGPMYAAFMTTGMGYETFMSIVDGLADGGKIRIGANSVAYPVKEKEG